MLLSTTTPMIAIMTAETQANKNAFMMTDSFNSSTHVIAVSLHRDCSPFCATSFLRTVVQPAKDCSADCAIQQSISSAYEHRTEARAGMVTGVD
jgi:hypothetical protein